MVPYGEVDLTAGEIKTVNLTITKGRRISGRVTEVNSGEPVVGVDVFSNITRLEEPRWAFGNGFHPTNEKGEFEFFALPGHAALNVNVHPDNWKTIPESKTEFEIVVDQDPSPVELKIQTAKTGQLRPKAIHTLNVGPSYITTFVFDSECKTIITVGGRVDERIANDQERMNAVRADLRVWDVATGREITRFGDEPGSITSLAISTDGKSIVTGIARPGNPGLIRIWDLETKELRLTLTGHSKSVVSVDVSSDGRFVASGSSDQTARIWDAAMGEEVFVLPHQWSPNKLQFSPDGKLLATSGSNGEVKFWEVETGIERATFEAKKCWIHGLAWSPTGKHLAIACVPFDENGRSISSQTPGSIRLWDVANEPDGTFVVERNAWSNENHPSGIAFSPNGKFIADARHNACVWRMPTGDEVAVVRQSRSSSSDRVVQIESDSLPTAKSWLSAAANQSHSGTSTNWEQGKSRRAIPCASELRTLGNVKKRSSNGTCHK